MKTIVRQFMGNDLWKGDVDIVHVEEGIPIAWVSTDSRRWPEQHVVTVDAKFGLAFTVEKSHEGEGSKALRIRKK